MSAEPPAFPKALDDDEDDVAWALQTAAVQWERGGHADAIVWLRRAAQAAIEAQEFSRAADLERGARLVETWVERGVVGPAPDDDDDDGVDSLLATEAPDIEAGEFSGPSPSLVDVLEAEERGDFRSKAPEFADVTEVGDLGDMQDVEDIEADDVVDLSEDVTFPLDFPPEPATMAQEGSDSDEITGRVRLPAESLAPLSLPLPPARPPKPASRSSFPVVPPPPAPLLEAREPLPSEPPREVSAYEIDVDVPPASLPEPPEPPEPPPPPSVPPEPAAPPSVRLRSDPPFEATLVDASAAHASAADASPGELPPAVPPDADEPSIEMAMLDAPIVEPTLVEARRPDEESDLPASDGSAEAAQGPDTAPTVTAGHGVDVALLAACRGLEDLPPETQAELAALATLERLAPEQEVSGFGLAIVARGDVLVMPTIAEAACGHARRGEPVFSRGNLAEGVSLRVVALADGAEVAVLRAEDFEHMLATCPWVAEELRTVADRFQALAGVAMGPLGERLDDSMRAMVTDRCEVRLLQAGDVLMEEGKPVAGLHVVGGGKLEMVRGGAVDGELTPGDLAFASGVLSHEPAPATLRAAAGGALVVVADRMTTHELLVSVPPLLELLATA